MEIKNDLLVARTTFENNSSGVIHLDGMTLGVNGELKRKVFSINGKSEQQALYTGPIQKRIVRPEEFVSIQVGGSITTSLVLNSAYDLRKGNNYTIEYNAYNPQSFNEGDPLIKMISNKVTVSY